MGSLIRRKPARPEETVTLMTLKDAAAMLCLTPSAVRQGKAGTAHLTKVRQGEGKRQPIFLVREEVEAHIRSLVDHARGLHASTERHSLGT